MFDEYVFVVSRYFELWILNIYYNISFLLNIDVYILCITYNPWIILYLYSFVFQYLLIIFYFGIHIFYLLKNFITRTFLFVRVN